MFDEDGKEYTIEVNLPPSNYLNLPKRILERHLTQESYRMTYEVQSIGTHLQCLFRSERDKLLLRIPYDVWRAGPPRKRKLNDWSLYLNRWADDFEVIGRVVEHDTEKRIIPIEIKVIDESLLKSNND